MPAEWNHRNEVYRGDMLGAVDDGRLERRMERTNTTARGTSVIKIPKTAKKMASLESPSLNW